MRGTRRSPLLQICLYGIIPACAGNTIAPIRSIASLRDHPRVCGEHLSRFRALARWHEDHPRVCGEHALDWESQDNPQGSSPRVRGTRVPLPPFATEVVDHPRVCGEHSTLTAISTLRTGSSPRVRGTLYRRFRSHADTGIIPACAGNTAERAWRGTIDGDHPRVCGEHNSGQIVKRLAGGSSPRVRGTPRAERHAGIADGIIPACAGNTPGPQHRVRQQWDHPRVCGEHTKKIA